MKNENIPYGTRIPVIDELIGRGFSNVAIWRITGIELEYISQRRSKFESVKFYENLKKSAEFFKGLSPREEYAKHAEFRKTIDEF